MASIRQVQSRLLSLADWLTNSARLAAWTGLVQWSLSRQYLTILVAGDAQDSGDFPTNLLDSFRRIVMRPGLWSREWCARMVWQWLGCSNTASFYERMRFIIEDRGLQSYAKKKGFNERWGAHCAVSVSLCVSLCN